MQVGLCDVANAPINGFVRPIGDHSHVTNIGSVASVLAVVNGQIFGRTIDSVSRLKAAHIAPTI